MCQNEKKYVVGEKYWFANPRAGQNMQSCGKLVDFDRYGNAVVFSERYGYITVTVENLDRHN